jgi:Flp pilus assembly protein TadD
MNGPNLRCRGKRGALVIAGLLIVVGGTTELAPLAAANSSNQSTATAPQQLVHAYPLGSRRLCCTRGNAGRTAARPAPRRAPAPARRPGGTHPSGSSNRLLFVFLGAVVVLLLIAGAHATYGTRRRRVAAALGAGNGAARGAAIEAARSAADGGSGWEHRVWVGDFSPFGERVRATGAEVEQPAGTTGANEREGVGIGGQELAYRRADAAGDADGAFNLGVLLHHRGNLAGARAAYERAERRGDPDAAFNLGVLLYESGDLDGAEAAWRRCIARGHPQAAENLRFLLQRRGAHADAGDIRGTESAERTYRRADEAGRADGAFNLGVLLHQRDDLAGARAAYERAERRGDPDAAFNLGVLLYESGDLDGAEAAWRRCVARGHPRAAENLRFLDERRGASTGVRKAAGVAGATDRAART